MDVLLSICVRGGSKGIPRKNMRPFCGVPLLGRTIMQAQETGYPFVVSTEDAEMQDYARSLGADVLVRPPELATDDANKWDVFRHIARKKRGWKILVDLDVCCPLRSVEDIEGAIHELNIQCHLADVVITTYPAERNPFFNMVFVGVNNMHVFTFPACVTRRQDAPPVFSLSPSVFAIRRPALWKYNHWSSSKMKPYFIPRSRAIDIDTEDDWQYAEWLFRKGQE